MYTLSDKIVDQNITHFCPKKKKKNVKNFNLQNFLLWTYFLVGLNYIYIYLSLNVLPQDSLLNSRELLSTRVLPSLRNNYKGAHGISNDLAIFTIKGLTGNRTGDILTLSSMP